MAIESARFPGILARGGATLLAIMVLWAAACAPPPDARSSRRQTREEDVISREDGEDGERDATEEQGEAPRGTPGGGDDEPLPVIDTSALDPFFADQMARARIPGLSVAVVRDAKLKWAKGYGLADIARGRDVTTDTLFMLASVSKTVTAVALMQLIEDPARGISLDQDVSEKLPFRVRNPRFASTPITFRMVLAHTSTLIDPDTAGNAPGDSPTALADYVRASVGRSAQWLDDRPGTVYDYSNTGIALAGLLVEAISGTNLQDYCRKNVFGPLAMRDASFFLRDLDPARIAVPHEGPAITAKAHYGYPDDPAGQIRTTAVQLGHFLSMFAAGGTYRGVEVLRRATVEEMKRPQFAAVEPTQGLVWYTDPKGGAPAIGHNGSDEGVRTDMYFDPVTTAGFVLLANARGGAAEATENAAFTAMNDRLMQLARSLP